MWLADDVAGFSWNVLAAAPAVKRISIQGSEPTPLGVAALRPVNAALRNGALQELEEVVLRKCALGDGDIREFLDALKESGCAKRLTTLAFLFCEVGVEGIRIAADHIGRGVFSALKILDVGENPNISDVGVLALAEALINSTQTFLTALSLENVGMGDEGISAVASLVSQGRLEHLKTLYISENAALTEQGIITLARAIGAGGLPELRRLGTTKLGEMTARGIAAMAHAVFKGCPQVKDFHLTVSGPACLILREVVNGMLEAAGRAGKVKMHYYAIEY
jgi:hypothetical protein